MQPTPLRVALVGCGRIGSHTRPELYLSLPPGWIPLNHADAIRATPGLLLDSVCDLDPTNLEQARQTLNVRGYSDSGEQIERTRPEIVSIATRTSARGKIIGQTLKYGVRGIHCEKPLATNMATCRHLLATIAEGNIKLTYGTTRRFMEIYRTARSLVEAGEIGSLIDIEIQFGRTLLLWNHPHSVDLLLFFTNGALAIQVRGRCSFNNDRDSHSVIDDDPTVEDAMISFDNGVTGRISNVPGLNVVITGTAGNLRICDDGRWLDIDKGRGNSRRLKANPTMSGTVRAFHDLEYAVRYDDITSTDPGDIARGTLILLAIAKSAQADGAAISPNIVEDDFTVTGRFHGKFA
jgi:scyllo-inositol 2-dehydrogenase (NAD+)